MTDQAHDIMADFDEQIREATADLAVQVVAAGYRPDEVATVLRPTIDRMLAVRAKALARLECATVH